MAGPLTGIRVVDLTRARSGPTCVRQLVDLGAEALQVLEPNAPELLPGSDGWNLHRGKRTVALDLRSEADRDCFLALVDAADVLVENFRPSVKHRLGIDPQRLLARNPRLVYASISGFGQDGPLADRPCVDQIAQGMSGIMSVTGPPGSGPWRTGVAISDTVSGTFLAQAVLAALYSRERTGQGQWVHTSLLESLVNVMDFQAARYLNEGDVPGQAGNDHPTIAAMGTFRTSDGWINLAVLGRFGEFCVAIERPELRTDPRFATAGARNAHRNELRAEIASALHLDTTAGWLARLSAADLPCGPVLTVDEVFAEPQVRRLQMTAPVARADGGTAHVLRHPVTFTGTPLPGPGPVATPAADVAEVLARWRVTS